MADDIKRVVVWKNLLLNGTDYCALSQTAEGWLLKGTVVGVLKDQRPMLVNHEIYCDKNWLTHRVQVERSVGDDVKILSLSVESRGVWRSSGQELPRVRGCDDVESLGDACHQRTSDSASQHTSGPQRIRDCCLGQISRLNCGAVVATLHAAWEKHLSLRKQHRILGSDCGR